MAGQLILGVILAALVSHTARLARSLSRSGALAAFMLGSVVFGLGGLRWAVLLLCFFITSSGLSSLFRRRKSGLEEKYAKGAQRDARQVFANGGISGLFVLAHLAWPQSWWPWLAFAGSLAAANADTWATEIGVLAGRKPRLITTMKPVEMGTSGGISLAGTLAALAGAVFIAVPAALLLPGGPVTWQAGSRLFLTILLSLGGLAGSLVDSLLGATWQGIYFCPACGKETEKHPLHGCGSTTRLLRGKTWVDNDLVNLACTFTGGVIGVMIGFLH